MKRYSLTLAPVTTPVGEVHFPTDDLRLVLAQGDPQLTFTWQNLMTAATQGRLGPFTPRQFFEGEMGGHRVAPASAESHLTVASVEEDLDKLAALGLVQVEFLN